MLPAFDGAAAAAEAPAGAAAAGGKGATDRGHSDSSTGKSSVVSTAEHLVPSQESSESLERGAAEGVSERALAKEPASQGSEQLKTQLHSILDAVFG